jgi:hypothetical protein
MFPCRVYAAAKKHNVFCMEALWSRFIPALVEVKVLIVILMWKRRYHQSFIIII